MNLSGKISYDGFVYHAAQDDRNEIFLFRFGIIHCVADSGVFGLRVELPEQTVTENDQWLHIGRNHPVAILSTL